ncbi:MAG: flagellar hook-length control protein FliK [Pseudomonadota bacterium]
MAQLNQAMAGCPVAEVGGGSQGPPGLSTLRGALEQLGVANGSLLGPSLCPLLDKLLAAAGYSPAQREELLGDSTTDGQEIDLATLLNLVGAVAPQMPAQTGTGLPSGADTPGPAAASGSWLSASQLSVVTSGPPEGGSQAGKAAEAGIQKAVAELVPEVTPSRGGPEDPLGDDSGKFSIPDLATAKENGPSPRPLPATGQDSASPQVAAWVARQADHGRGEKAADAAVRGARTGDQPSASEARSQGQPVVRMGHAFGQEAALRFLQGLQPGSGTPAEEEARQAEQVDNRQERPGAGQVSSGDPIRGMNVLEKTSAQQPTTTAGKPASSPEMVRHVAQQVERAMLSGVQRGEDSLKLRLHPPELGNLRLDLALRGEGVKVVMVAETAAAKDILQAALPELRGSLAEQGLKIEEFSVSVQNDGRDQFASLGGDSQGETYQQGPGVMIQAEESAEVEDVLARAAMAPSRGGVDLFC